MIRIGILGTDNSHSIAFSRLFNVKEEKPHVRGAKVVAVYGDEDKRNREVAEKGCVGQIVKRPSDMIGMIDAAIVDFRHGSRHYKFAKPLIEAGIPTFIDKPFAATVAHANRMTDLARRKRCPITTFSTVRYGPAVDAWKKDIKKLGRVKTVIISGPGSTKSEYDGLFFYAVHQVELMLECFGDKIKSVRGVDYDGTLVATVSYRNGMVVTLHEIDSAYRNFAAIAHGEGGEAVYDVSKAHDGYYYGAKILMEMFKGGKMPIAYKDLATSTRILAAIERSVAAGGKEVTIR